MTITRVLPPFAAVEELRPRAARRRKVLLQAASRAGVRVWQDDDAVALEYADGCDDYWISEHQLATARGRPEQWAAELLEEIRAIGAKRARVLSAVRHALVAAKAYLDRSRSGFWGVAVGGLTTTFEVGSTLTHRILEEDQAEALLQAFRELYLWRHKPVKTLLRDGPEGADWPDAAVRMSSRIEEMSLEKVSWVNLQCLLNSGVEPRGERTWAEYEALHDYTVQLPERSWRPGPELPELTRPLAGRLDAFAASTFEHYRQKAAAEPWEVRMEWPWFVPGDDWTSVDWHLEAAERIASRPPKPDGRLDYPAIAARMFMVRHGREEHRLSLYRDLDRWWDGGGHDLQDWPGLVALFPRHPAGTEIRDSHGVHPPPAALEAELPPRRYFRESLLDGLREVLAATSEAERFFALDDLYCLVRDLGPVWTPRLLRRHPAELAEMRRATAGLLDLPGAELGPWFDEALIAAGCFGWNDLVEAAGRRPDLSGLFFYPLARFDELDLDRELERAARQIQSRDVPVRADREPEGYLACGRALSVLSQVCPRRRTARLAAAVLLLCVRRRQAFEDQLAAAIAWHRCRRPEA